MNHCVWSLVPYNFIDLEYQLYCYSILDAFQRRELEVEEVVLETDDWALGFVPTDWI